MAKKNAVVEALIKDLEEIGDGRFDEVNAEVAEALVARGWGKAKTEEEHPKLTSYKDGEAVSVLVPTTGEWEDTWITETHAWGIEAHTSRGPITIGKREFIKRRIV